MPLPDSFVVWLWRAAVATAMIDDDSEESWTVSSRPSESKYSGSSRVSHALCVMCYKGETANCCCAPHWQGRDGGRASTDLLVRVALVQVSAFAAAAGRGASAFVEATLWAATAASTGQARAALPLAAPERAAMPASTMLSKRGKACL